MGHADKVTDGDSVGVREELDEVVVDRSELREELEEALSEMRDMKKFLADTLWFR